MKSPWWQLHHQAARTFHWIRAFYHEILITRVPSVNEGDVTAGIPVNHNLLWGSNCLKLIFSIWLMKLHCRLMFLKLCVCALKLGKHKTPSSLETYEILYSNSAEVAFSSAARVDGKQDSTQGKGSCVLLHTYFLPQLLVNRHWLRTDSLYFVPSVTNTEGVLL